MKRFARNLFLLCAAVSLLLCVALSVLWIRSAWKGDVLVWTGSHSFVLRSEQGLIRVDVSSADPADPQRFRRDSWPHPPDWSAWRWLGPRWWDRIGFGHYVGGSRTGARVDQFVFPHYALVVLTAMLPAVVFTRWVYGRRRRRVGLCPRCGYDLRASPERCPECGTPADPPRIRQRSVSQ